MQVPFSTFTLAELKVIQDFALFHSDGCPVDWDGKISAAIYEKVNLMAYAERALLLAKQALQSGHWKATQSTDPDVGVSAFQDALQTVNKALSMPNDRVVGDDWLVVEAERRSPRAVPLGFDGDGSEPNYGGSS